MSLKSNNKTKVEESAFASGFIASRHRMNSKFNPYCGKNGSYDVDSSIFSIYGCPQLKDFQEDCANYISPAVYKLAKMTSLSHFEYFQTEENESLEAVNKIKQVLDKKIPVLIVVHMTDEFVAIGTISEKVSPMLPKTEKSRTAHDICNIGYDDRETSKTKGRFLVKNNYEDWGNQQAMAWVRYEDMMYMIEYAAYFTIK